MVDHQNRIDVPQVYPLGETFLSNDREFHIRDDRITCMAAGDRHTIIVTEYGRVYSFGDNNSGQLGFGHTNDMQKVSSIKSLRFHETGERVILAACGQESSLVATNRGVLYSFGSNHYCQLGFESEESTKIHPHPVKIEYFDSKMSWKQISMGAEHACALTEDGQVYMWGSNRDGQCGQARKHDIVRKPRELQLQDPIIAISCGYHHTALIDENGRLFLFGNNASRQLGRSVPNESAGPLQVSFPDSVTAVACGGQHTVVLTDKGEIYTCGLGDRGQLGQGSSILLLEQFEKIENLPKHLTSIAAGKHHTSLLGSHGDMYICGDYKHDQLLHKTHSNPFKPTPLRKFKKLHVLNVVCGGHQTIVLAQNKSMEGEADLKSTLDSGNKPLSNVTNPHDHSGENDLRNSSTDFKDAKTEIPSPEPSLTTRRNNANHHVSDASAFNDPVYFVTPEDSKNTQIAKQNFDYDESSSESSLSSTSERFSQRRNFLHDDKSQQLEASSDEDPYRIKRQSSLSTNSGRSSSSISSVHKDPVSKSMAGSRLSRTEEVVQPDATIHQTQSRFFTRIFGRKSFQNEPTNNTSPNSKVCSLM